MNQLKALILSGGESRRMGVDKGSMPAPFGLGQTQRQFLQFLLEKEGLEVFHSVRLSQNLQGMSEDQMIRDKDTESMGPAAGIVQAHLRFPDVAWLVLACDFLRPQEAILNLLKARDSEKAATVFVNAEGFYEPLFAIWEQAALKAMLQGWKQNEKSPQYVLKALEIKSITADLGWLKSANTAADLKDQEALMTLESHNGKNARII